MKKKNVVISFLCGVTFLFASDTLLAQQSGSSLSEAEQQRMEADMDAFKEQLSITRKLPVTEIYDQRVLLKNEYIEVLSGYVDSTLASSYVVDTMYRHIAVCSGGINEIDLSDEQLISVGKIYYERDRELKVLPSMPPSYEKKETRDDIMKRFDDSLLEIVGPVKFRQFVIFRDGTVERRYKTQYGFSNEEFANFVEIENQYAIERINISKYDVPAMEKDALITSAKNSKVEAMRNILPASTFEKWHAEYLAADKLSWQVLQKQTPTN